MEIISFNSKADDIAEAIRGPHGKETYSDCSIIYLGIIVIVIGSLESAIKKLKCKHSDWEQIGDKVWISVIQN